MAITVGGDLGISKAGNEELISGFNPCLISFTTDQTGGVRGVMSIYKLGSGVGVETNVTPDGNGVFYYDFQGGFKDYANESEFYYEPQFSYPDISTVANALFIDNQIVTGIEWSFDIFNSIDVNIDLVGSGGYYFMKSSTQVGNSPIMTDYNASLSGGWSSLNESTEGVIVWSGFPIDIQTDRGSFINANIFINSVYVTGNSFATGGDERILRAVLIDTLGNELSGLDVSDNVEMRINDGVNFFVSETKLNYKVPNCPERSKYFRYLNSKGGNSYFLFEDHYQTEVERENKDNINRRFDSLETASSRTVSLGNENSYALLVHHLATTKLENDLLQGLLLSPVIELYDADKQTFNRVNLIGNDSDKLTSKTQNTNYNFTFDLGVKYNQSI